MQTYSPSKRLNQVRKGKKGGKGGKKGKKGEKTTPHALMLFLPQVRQGKAGSKPGVGLVIGQTDGQHEAGEGGPDVVRREGRLQPQGQVV